jgi:signal recognition particle GTPase
MGPPGKTECNQYCDSTHHAQRPAGGQLRVNVALNRIYRRHQPGCHRHGWCEPKVGRLAQQGDGQHAPMQTMASALTDKLSRLVKEIRGQARITEANVQDMLREVRMALLEADVALPVVRDFIARVKEKALGQEVLGSLSPGQALVGIVNRSWPPPWARASATSIWPPSRLP